MSQHSDTLDGDKHSFASSQDIKGKKRNKHKVIVPMAVVEKKIVDLQMFN